MTPTQIATRKLTNQRLIGKSFVTPQAAIKAHVAMQAQDYAGAKWGLAQRVKGTPTDTDLNSLFDRGVFLRTHIMRPTWHFVLPDDIVWLQMLTAPRVRAANAYYERKLGVDEKIIAKSKEVLARELSGGRHLTRPQIAQKFANAGIQAAGLRFAYIIMSAELDALICSGARRGKAHTYALVSERAPKARQLGREEALTELTVRYFTGHGPAQVKDFAWWSGLTVKDITAGLDFAKAKLVSQEVDGKVYWFADTPQATFRPPIVHLLPNYDEFLIAYKDHSASFDPKVSAIDIGTRNFVLANHIVVISGCVVGGWRRVVKGRAAKVEVRLLRKVSAAERLALQAEVDRYAAFAGVAVVLRFINE